MFVHSDVLLDVSLALLRVMVGTVFASSGWSHLKDPVGRSKSIELPVPVTIVLGVAELLGALGVVLGVLVQPAALGLILIMLGAIQKKIFVWKTGFWGSDGLGWSYDLMLVSMLLVIFASGGGAYGMTGIWR